jgi:hypothetical protein
MRLQTSFACLLLSSAAIAGAQGTDPEHAPGSLRVVNEIPNAQGLTAAQRAQASAIANGVIILLRRDPAIANPVGYSVTVRAVAHSRLPGDAPGIPYHVVLYGQANYFEWHDNARGTRQVQLGSGGFDFTIAVNAVGYPAELDAADEELDHGTRVMGADEGERDIYRVTGSFRGHPVYGGSCTYLSHRTVPPVVAVTKERYLSLELLKLRGAQTHHETQRAQTGQYSSNDQLQKFLRDRPSREASNRKTLDALRSAGASDEQIRQAAATFDEVEKQHEAALRKATGDGTDEQMQNIVASGQRAEADRIASKQAALDALSPAERRSQAALVIHGRGQFSLGDISDPSTLPLIQPNAAFYDTSLGAGVPQLIWLCAYHFQGLEDKSYERLASGSDEWKEEKAWNERRIRDVVRLRDQLDWSALDALVKP